MWFNYLFPGVTHEFFSFSFLQLSITRLLESGDASSGQGRASSSFAWAQTPQGEVEAFRDYQNFSVPDYTSSQLLRDLGRPGSRLMTVFEQWMYDCTVE